MQRIANWQYPRGLGICAHRALILAAFAKQARRHKIKKAAWLPSAWLTACGNKPALRPCSHKSRKAVRQKRQALKTKLLDIPLLPHGSFFVSVLFLFISE